MKKAQRRAVAVSAGVAALAAAAAGVYMLTGKNAKNRKKLAKWADRMRDDVVRELKNAQTTSRAAYNKAVDTVAKNYKGLRDVNATELAGVAAELKSHWDAIRDELSQASKTVRRIKPKVGSRSAKVRAKVKVKRTTSNKR